MVSLVDSRDRSREVLGDKGSKPLGGLSDLPTGKMPRRPDMPDMEAWIKQGMDPVHAAYAFVQNITSQVSSGGVPSIGGFNVAACIPAGLPVPTGLPGMGGGFPFGR